MRQALEAHKISLELAAKSNPKKTIMIFVIGVSIIAITYLLEYRYFSPQAALSISLPFFVGFILLLASTRQGISGLSEEDRAFLNVMEAIELKEKGLQDVEVLKHASNKLREASKKLEYLLSSNENRVSPAWYSELRDIENTFVHNLMYRAVPALKEGKIDLIQLEHIAAAFIGNDTKRMKVANEIMEEFEPIEMESPKLKSFRVFYRSSLGQLTFSLIFGFFLLFVLLWLLTSFTKQDFWVYVTNPTFTIIGGIAGSSFVHFFMKRE